MKKSKKCIKCGSEKITYADRILSGGGFAGGEYIGTETKVFGGMKHRFVAYICDECGYSELYLVKD